MKTGLTAAGLKDMRCSACRKLLFKSEDGALSGVIQIKCPRCGAFNLLRPMSPDPSAACA